jgi:hypothetical protein
MAMAPPPVDRTGHVFGSWTVLRRGDPPTRGGCPYWTCRCACGGVADVRGKNLTMGRSVQCKDCAASRKRGTIVIRWGDRVMNLSQWSASLGLLNQTVWSRIKMDWPLEEALTKGADPMLLALLVPDRSKEPVRLPTKKNGPASRPQPQGKQ